MPAKPRDPFLDAHEILDNFFLLSAGIAPISIRDQIVRGVFVIDHALSHNRIRTDDSILVVGAGAAGVTAAIRAVGHGLHVVLLERLKAPFLVQSRAATRWVDPTQYDWPLEHWHLAFYPWQLPLVLLNWKADWAPLISAGWHSLLRRAKRLFGPKLDIRYQTTADKIHSSTLKVELSDHTQLQPRIIVWTTGFGQEDCSIKGSHFSGFPFWSRDPFTSQGLGTGRNCPSVTIDGVGDGGLQDYLRVCTGKKSAKEIYQAVLSNTRFERPVMRFLRDKEDLAHRCWLWSGNKEKDHENYRWLHRQHQFAAISLLSDPSVVQKLRSLIGPTLRCKPLLIYRCDHFTNFYPLNQLLVCLIAGFLVEEHQEHTLSPGHSLVGIQSADTNHQCRHDPNDCSSYPHNVDIAFSPLCFAAPTQHTYQTRFDLVIIRRGIDSKTLSAPPLTEDMDPKDLQRTRHSIPYHLIS